ncbi:MAG: hypothetical protein EPO35_03625 [Acidobacteria bacterium]|nr:MAG: hypothetical protein EPO35_03625 [Acidobacteriota bacterium]
MNRARLLVFIAALPAATPAFAQSPPRLLLDVGAVVVGAAGAGSATANYTAPDGSPVPLFSLSKSVAPAIGVNTHLQIRLTPRVALEVTGEWTRPNLRTKLSGDADGADNVTATQPVHRFVLGGGAVVRLKPFGKWHTFTRASVGWLRELSDDLTLYQDGWVVQAGGGANYQWQEKRGHLRPYAIRTDLWLDIRQGGLKFSTKPRLFAPAFSAALILKL